MITLYTFGPFFGLPDASPFVMKGEMLLKLAKLEYQTSTKGFLRAPKGKLPYIDDNGTIVADSTLIRLHLEQKHGIDFDRALSARERGIAWATEKMLEDHLYWVLVYWRWMKDENFAKGPANFFKRAPAFIRPLIIWKVRGNVRRSLHAHGIGRHNEAEMTAMSDRAFEALSQLLGENQYLMGDAAVRRRCHRICVHRRLVVSAVRIPGARQGARAAQSRRLPRPDDGRVLPRL